MTGFIQPASGTSIRVGTPPSVLSIHPLITMNPHSASFFLFKCLSSCPLTISSVSFTPSKRPSDVGRHSKTAQASHSQGRWRAARRAGLQAGIPESLQAHRGFLSSLLSHRFPNFSPLCLGFRNCVQHRWSPAFYRVSPGSPLTWASWRLSDHSSVLFYSLPNGGPAAMV